MSRKRSLEDFDTDTDPKRVELTQSIPESSMALDEMRDLYIEGMEEFACAIRNDERRLIKKWEDSRETVIELRGYNMAREDMKKEIAEKVKREARIREDAKKQLTPEVRAEERAKLANILGERLKERHQTAEDMREWINFIIAQLLNNQEVVR